MESKNAVITPEILKTLREGIDSSYEPIKRGPARSNWASQLGKPCDRYHVFNRLDWNLAEPLPATVARSFTIGREFEKLWIRQARNVFTIYDEQVPIEWRKYQISGRLDGRIEVDLPGGERSVIPFEIKTMHPFWWGRFNEDDPDAWKKFFESAFYMAWPGQGQCYMLSANEEQILFILINKANLREKFITVPLDMEYAETLVARAERVNECVRKEQRPGPIEYSEKVCGICPYFKVCYPNRTFTEAQWINDEDLVAALNIVEKNKSAKLEYDRANRQVKKKLHGVEHAIIGEEFEITGQGKTVHYKAQPERDVDQWKINIRRMGDKPAINEEDD